MQNDLISEDDKIIETEQDQKVDIKQTFELYMTQYGEIIAIELANKICNILNKSFRKAIGFHRKSSIFTDRLLGEFIYEDFIKEAEKELGVDFSRNSKHEIDEFCKRFDQECSLSDLKTLLNAFYIWRLHNLVLNLQIENKSQSIFFLKMQSGKH